MVLSVHLTLYFSTFLWAQCFIVLPTACKISQNLSNTILYTHLSICYSLLVFKIHLNNILLEEHFIPKEWISCLPGVFILYLFISLFLAFIRIYNLHYTESSSREGIILHICDFEIPLSITVINTHLWIE